ncbi:MAG: sigma-54-dependent Fis family transcriptional regulator [Myxococcales bacterium]|nr:MAG: sigma-54-dependent Fis family transcriptional regulator [Myxococcales bacterium]
MNETAKQILVVDDDRATVEVLSRALATEGYATQGALSAEEALAAVRERDFDLVISDLVMPGMDGLHLLEAIKQHDPCVGVVVCTGFGTIPSAVEAIRKGAADYLTKPVNLEQLILVVERTLKVVELADENRLLKEELSRQGGFEEIVGHSPAMEKVFSRVLAAAPTDATVLIRGESGTGKELVARAIHRRSRRAGRPLVAVNCAAFTETLIESELFGHEKGAFTGAYKQTKGRVESAHGGTLFLDEIGDLSPTAQSKLLRLIQERTFERVGSAQSLSADVRIIGATHRNLEKLIEEGKFREDLYYRINVIAIDLPPLRERMEDIGVLLNTFLAEFKAKYQKPALTVAREAVAAMERYDWPGNVREMRNLVENLVILAQGERIAPADLPEKLSARSVSDNEAAWLSGAYTLDEVEREVIRRTLLRTGGNKSEAAKLLGIGLKTLYRRLSEEAAVSEGAADE